MPDILKEMQQALIAGVQRQIERNMAQKGLRPPPPGRTLAAAVAQAGGPGITTQNVFTTGYDAVNKVTTVPVTLDFSTLDGSDMLTT